MTPWGHTGRQAVRLGVEPRQSGCRACVLTSLRKEGGEGLRGGERCPRGSLPLLLQFLARTQVRKMVSSAS